MSAKQSTTEIVLEAIQDLHAREQIVTRETLQSVTGLKMTVIDDRISHLLDHGNILRVQRGVFVPDGQHRPARPISRTVLPDGSTVLEIGDDVLQLTPREARMLGEAMAGSACLFATIELGQQAIRQTNVFGMQLSEIRRELRQLQERNA